MINITDKDQDEIIANQIYFDKEAIKFGRAHVVFKFMADMDLDPR